MLMTFCIPSEQVKLFADDINLFPSGIDTAEINTRGSIIV